MTIGIIVVISVLILCLIGLFLPSCEAKNSLEQTGQPVFSRIYGTISPSPTLKVSWSYGYPAFEITFVSKADFECAAQQNQVFKREIGELFARYGSIERPFDAELAIFFNHSGCIQELLARQSATSGYAESKQSIV